MKRLYKRVLASLLVCLSLLANCTPFLSVVFAQDVSSTVSVSFGDGWASGNNVDDLLSLAGLSYFASNGTNMISYNQTGETLVDTYMRYYKQFYEEQIVQAGATSDFYNWIANSITENALGIRRVAGAVSGAANILIGEPLAQILNPFLNWFNNKFNPGNVTETERTVEVVRDVAVAAVTVPNNFTLTVFNSGDLVSYTNNGSFPYTEFRSGSYMFTGASSNFNSLSVGSALYSLPYLTFFKLNEYEMGVKRRSDGYIFPGVTINVSGYTSSTHFYRLVGCENGVALGMSGYSSLFIIGFGRIPYTEFYSTSEQFSDSGLSVLTMSVSSDGSLSYGPDTSTADNIVQNNQTLSVPVIAPSLSGDASLSFETTDSVAELLEKALASVQAALSDASANTLELPSNDESLPPEIEILDDDDISWADDSVVEVTPTPTPTPGAVVTVGPSPAVTPWPVSDPQLAVVGPDGQTTLVDVVQTIKGWTGSLTDVYQMYVNLISALFPFLPDELIVLLNWSLSALIFTGLFKRWWWSHH